MCTGRDVHASGVSMLKIACLLVLLLPCVASRFFKYATKEADEIYLDVDFSIKLTAKYHGNVIAEKVLTATDVSTTQGSASSPERYISLSFDSGENFKFTFTPTSYSETSSVELSHRFRFSPSSSFSHLEVRYGYACFKGSSTRIGNQVSSYVCAREDRSSYTRTQCDDRVTSLMNSKYEYSAEIDIKQIHAQAFGISDNVFSTPVFCGPNRNIAGIIAGSVVGVVVFLVIVAAVIFLVLRHKKKNEESGSRDEQNNVQEPNENSSLIGSGEDRPSKHTESA